MRFPVTHQDRAQAHRCPHLNACVKGLALQESLEQSGKLQYSFENSWLFAGIVRTINKTREVQHIWKKNRKLCMYLHICIAIFADVDTFSSDFHMCSLCWLCSRKWRIAMQNPENLPISSMQIEFAYRKLGTRKCNEKIMCFVYRKACSRSRSQLLLASHLGCVRHPRKE